MFFNSKKISTHIAPALFMAFNTTAFAAVLGEADVRSYLGAPIEIRIPVAAAGGEALEVSCFSLPALKNEPGFLSARDVRLSLFESRALTYLQIDGRIFSNEPVIQFRLRSGCGEANALYKDYVVLLDPMPLMATANALSVTRTEPVNGNEKLPPELSITALPVENAQKAMKWVVGTGDTLESIARGIFPNSRRSRTDYIAAIKSANPVLNAMPETQALEPGTTLSLPDIRSVKAATPIATPSNTKALTATKSRSAKNLLPTAKPNGTTTIAPVTKKNSSRKATSTGQFQLKLSSSEMDLSSQKNVTAEQRAELREKQLLLDADDQVATMLAMKNTVRQLETRLNELQLKLAGMPGLAAPGASSAVALPSPESGAVISPASDIAGHESANTQSASLPAATAVAPSAKLGQGATATATSPDITAASAATETGSMLGRYGLWLLLTIAALGLWWVWRRSKNSDRSPIDNLPTLAPGLLVKRRTLDTVATPNPQSLTPSLQPPPTGMPNDKAELTVASAMATTMAPINYVPAIQLLATATEPGKSGDELSAEFSTEFSLPESLTPTEFNLSGHDDVDADDAALEAFLNAPLTLSIPAMSASLPTVSEDSASAKVFAPLVLETPITLVDSTDSFNLDEPKQNTRATARAASKLTEDRIRRRNFMDGRYPELATGTVLLDAPDTIIDAARLYVEDGDQEKAIELLIYSLEERPQELRFWLAQFELYRRFNLAIEFSALASKFNIFFGDSPEWKKICAAGFALDNKNPQFLRALKDRMGGTSYDPSKENWLNEHKNAQSIALAIEFRAAVFSEYQITESHFKLITDVNVVEKNTTVAAMSAPEVSVTLGL